MEDNLDKIEEGGLKWVDIVKDFYVPFDKDLKEAMEVLGRVKPEDIPMDETCESCGKPMVNKWGMHGRFIACTGFPECKNTRPLETEENGTETQVTDEKCEKCGAPMVLKTGKFGRFLACSKYPECKNTKAISIGVKCPDDGGDLVERRTKKGKVFYSCGNYPKCKFATWYKPVKKKCPDCGAGFLAEKRTKKVEQYVCLNKKCNYKEEILEDSSEEGEAEE
jgi:DNA topoisomerase-1